MIGLVFNCVTNVLQVSEYLVVCFTSSLTFSIAGVAKEIMTLSLAVYIYNEHLSYINLVSCAHCGKTLIHSLLHDQVKKFNVKAIQCLKGKELLSGSKRLQNKYLLIMLLILTQEY